MQLVANCSVFCSWRWGWWINWHCIWRSFSPSLLVFPFQLLLYHCSIINDWFNRPTWCAAKGLLSCPTWTTLCDNYINWYVSHIHIYICIYFLLPLAVFRIAQLVQWLGYTLDDWETRVWFLEMERFHSIQTGSGAHHAYAQGLKEQNHAADHSCQLVVILRICGDIPPLPHMPPRCSV